MNSKQRILATLEHRESDRVPLDIGGFNNTTMHHSVYAELRQRLGLPAKTPTIRAWSQKVVVPDEDVLEHFGADARVVYLDEAHAPVDNGDGTLTDMWGIRYRLNPDGYYYNMCAHPLGGAESVADIEAYRFPELNERMVAGLKDRVAGHPDKCLVLEGFRESMFGLPSWLRGTENFYMDLASEDDMCPALLDRVLDYIIRMMDHAMAAIGGGVDIIKFADDMGTQSSLLLSPESYRKYIKPRHARLFAHAKQKYGAKVLLHACGAIRPSLGDLTEIGVDAINPVQISAAGMEPAGLKRDFGKKVTFWGGGVDTQGVLAFGAPAEVKKQVAENLKIFKAGGGYVFCQVHNIMPGVPIDNVLAMYEAYKNNA